MGKRLSTYFTKNVFDGWYTSSLRDSQHHQSLGKCKIKTTVTCYYTPSRMGKIVKADNTK